MSTTSREPHPRAGDAESREEQLARALAEAQRARDVLLGIASHEIKMPVTSIRGYAQLVLRRLDRDGEVDAGQLRKAMVTIDQQAERLGFLLAQLLDSSRIEAGRMTLECAWTDVAQLVAETAARIGARAADRLIEVIAPDGGAHAEVDATRIQQVVTHLIDNAIRYSPGGGPVHVEVAPSPSEVVVAVRDHGIGVPSDLRERIFERFFQTDVEGFKGGLGLGLYLSRRIVELHGGTIVLEAPLGGGSRFVVALPCRRPAHASGEPPRVAGTGQSPAGAT